LCLACLALVYSASWSRRSFGGVARLTPISRPLARRDPPEPVRQRRIPSPRVVLSRGSERYCGPPRLPGPPPSHGWGEGRDPSPPWVSRVALGSVPTCHAPYPGERLRSHRSVAPTESGGLPCPKSRSTLTTSLSRLAQASHVLRPVPPAGGIRPRRTHVPRASAIRLPLWPLGSSWGVPTTPQAGLAPARTQRLSRRALGLGLTASRSVVPRFVGHVLFHSTVPEDPLWWLLRQVPRMSGGLSTFCPFAAKHLTCVGADVTNPAQG
jgi:hypothetical protein